MTAAAPPTTVDRPEPTAAPDRTGGPARGLRADARRNRVRILRAAEAVFAAGGAAAPTEEVAQRAGVGIATVFRHFPSKEALLAAVVVGRLRALTREADELATSTEAGEAFFGFFRRVIEQAARRTIYLAALADADATGDAGTRAGQDLLGAVGALLGRAQQAGAVRPTLQVSDVIALLVGTARAVEHAGWDRAAQDRILDVVFTGLRAGS